MKKVISKPKNKWISLFLCAFTICGHKFYEGRFKMGVIYIFTAGLFGIGWFIDLIRLLLKPNFYYVESPLPDANLSQNNYDLPLHDVSNYFKLENLEKRFSNKISISSNDTVAYFKNGQLYKTQPTDLETWYDVNYICSDGIYFNLSNICDIQKIPIPNFKTVHNFDNYSSIGSLDYVLRMKAGKFYNTKQKELCSACLWKSTELMLHNESFLWREYDYYRIVQWHLELGMFEEAQKAEYYIYTQLKKNKAYQKLISDIKHTPEYKNQQKEFFSKNQARKEYYKLVYLLPDVAPKSFSAYRKMKNQNTPRFLEIKRIAEENGIIILLDTSKKAPDKHYLTDYELELFARQCNYKLEHDDKL